MGDIVDNSSYYPMAYSGDMYSLRVPMSRADNFKVAGLRPRSSPYSFVVPQKSKQKKAPELLARHRRVPSVSLRFAAQKKTRYAQTFFFETLQGSTARRLRYTGKGSSKTQIKP